MLVVPWNLSTWFKQHSKLSRLFINNIFNTSIHLKLCTGGCWLVLSRTGQDMPTVLANIRLGDSWFQSLGRRISHSHCCLSFPGTPLLMDTSRLSYFLWYTPSVYGVFEDFWKFAIWIQHLIILLSYALQLLSYIYFS